MSSPDFGTSLSSSQAHQPQSAHQRPRLFDDPSPVANQKRKRGRPTNASRADEVKDVSKSPTTLEPQHSQDKLRGRTKGDAMDESSRPRERRRSVKNAVPSEPEPIQAQSTRRRRGRPSTTQMEYEVAENAAKSALSRTTETKKRGRPGKQGQPAGEPKQDAEVEAEEADDENEGNSSLLRRSNRHRQSVGGSSKSLEEQIMQGTELETLPIQRTGRRNQAVQLPEQDQPRSETEAEAKSKSTSRARRKRKKIGSASVDNQPPPIEEVAPELALPQKKRGRNSRPSGGNGDSIIEPLKRPSQEQPVDDEPATRSRRNRSNDASMRSKKRRRSFDGHSQSPARSSSPESVSSLRPYRHLTKRTRQVTHGVIESKWSPLDPSSVANISRLLQSVSRPVLLHVVNPKQYRYAEEILDKVTKGLCKRSGRLPFPPASTLPRRDDELDFERTQSAVEVLLSQLDPLQHSVELLRREKERAQKELERDYTVLNQLSANARSEARERRDRLKKVHVLVPEKAFDLVANNNIDVLPAGKGAGKVFTGIQDEELLELAGQVSNHMESMRGNLHQINGILPAIEKGHALLRTTLQPLFGPKQLEKIVLGQIEQ
ncbi:hypothetical protein F5Y19DRAFT_479116 [Xylariaceae sp. FL1651]|nr:hypothetical protein F5Y19DRAFT_479116 [Xylariaceae sp. FL1651]